MTEDELPGARGPGIGDDPATAERQGLELLAETSAAIVAALGRAIPEWAARQAARVLAAWGRHDGPTCERIVAEATEAGEAAARRVVGELRALLALDPERQRATPLQVIRTVYREPADVLRRAGVPPVDRDDFARRAWPDDDYGLVPDTMADLGDERLASLHLAWGVAKATVVRARRTRPPPA